MIALILIALYWVLACDLVYVSRHDYAQFPTEMSEKRKAAIRESNKDFLEWAALFCFLCGVFLLALGLAVR